MWEKVAAPVLVVHGSADTVLSRADAEAIAAIVIDVHPGQSRYLEIEGMAHNLTVNGRFHDPLIPTVLDWIRAVNSRESR